ncbi:MAG TPA: hypothetical protein VE053_03205 [Allosphingosinicella sp.]|nr:hypothetical protein [Allosphingosinicella sp.]
MLLLAAAAPAAAQVSASPAARIGDTRFQGPERAAIARCAPRIERFGRIQVDDVRRHGRSGWRVHGTVNDGGAGLGYSYGLRRGYGHRAFTCTVGEDGRVKLKTTRIRRY